MAEMLNEIENGKKWLKQMNIARAAFLPTEELCSMEPLEYRVLLMLPGIYRMWANVRLLHLAPWVKLWQLEGMYAGVEGKGAADAVYQMALRIELSHLKNESFEQPEGRQFCGGSCRHLQMLRPNPKATAI